MTKGQTMMPKDRAQEQHRKPGAPERSEGPAPLEEIVQYW